MPRTNHILVAIGLTNTPYSWNTNIFTDGDTFWLQLTGYSIDGTLTNSVVKEFTYDSSIGIAEKQFAHIKLHPNPALGTFSIRAKNIKQIEIFNNKGVLVKTVEKKTG